MVYLPTVLRDTPALSPHEKHRKQRSFVEAKMNPNLSIFTVLALYAISNVNGHGRFLEPPSRASMFRYAYTDEMLIPYRDIIEPNFGDNQLWCGGRERHFTNDGKCGACGDPYDGAREHEAGGKYALGIITRNYQQGQIIDVTVEMTAAHKGYFEFRLCPWNNIHIPVQQQCLKENLLNFENGEDRWYLPDEDPLGMHHLRVQLPQHITCSQCILQWRYRTGNSWGKDEFGEGLGYGQQEEFYGCSDVAIRGSGEGGVETSTSIITTTTRPPTSSTFSTTSSSSTTSKTSQSTTEKVEEVEPTSTTKSPNVDAPQGFDCSKAPLGLPVFRDCYSFYICSYPDQDPFIFTCPHGTVCDPKDGMCKNANQVPYCI